MSKTGYIYKLAIKDGSLDECYVGSTYRLRQRRGIHKYYCNNDNNQVKHNYLVYRFIRENGGWDNWELYPLEEIKYQEKIELLKKEREWIEKLKPKLNGNAPARNHKEYKATYYQNNKEILKEKHDTILDCKCGVKISYRNKARHEKSNKHQSFINQ